MRCLSATGMEVHTYCSYMKIFSNKSFSISHTFSFRLPALLALSPGELNEWRSANI